MYSEKLHTILTYLPKVGPNRAKILQSEYGLKTYADLLMYLPYRHEDKSQQLTIAQLAAMPTLPKKALLQGNIMTKEKVGQGRKRRLAMTLSDGTGTIELTWFRGIQWIDSSIEIGDQIQIYGKPSVFRNSLSMSHPETLKPESQSKVSTLTPFYSATEKSKKSGIDTKFFAQITQELFRQIQPSDILENLPQNLLDKYKLPSRFLALKWAHFPPDAEHYRHAMRRLKYEELFMMQLEYARMRLREKKPQSHKFGRVGDLFNAYYNEHLPFTLTGAQKKVIKEIHQDFKSGYQTNRLLQGDVGSGKTMVALLLMLIALDNGTQACLMAPTEILAQQHFSFFREELERLGIDVALLTGSTKKKDKKQIINRLSSGELRVVIGTHALIEPTVEFQNLGLVIIDEQHKFGVAQRARLADKNSLAPHVVVMTATPIPRSLALTAYGPMDISTIDELPLGRKPIITRHAPDYARMKVMSFIQSEINKGGQVYIVYPLIEESEKMDYESLERGYQEVLSYFPDMEYQISLVHGRQDIDVRETNMRRFIEGRTKILVATTVIEVGVNIPTASVMVIESSERFGLSQLHQLRGRVGRGSDQSYCILMTGPQLSEEAKKRISTMVESSDGFYIAEVDMQMRGPGNMMGTQQSGALDFKVVDLETDRKILEYARQDAIDILDTDPKLERTEHKPLRDYMQLRSISDWSEVL